MWQHSSGKQLICLPKLLHKLLLLSNSFNEGILKLTDGGADDPADIGDDVEDDCDEGLPNTCAKPKEYYSSVEFKASLVCRFHERIAA